MVRIKSVQPKENYTLLLTFTDGKEGVFDAKPYLTTGSVFKEIQDKAIFNSVRVNHGTIEWANGADLCPDCVYLQTNFY